MSLVQGHSSPFSIYRLTAPRGHHARRENRIYTAMENHQRGRSPSQASQHPIRHTPSPHNPQGPYLPPSSTGIPIDTTGAYDTSSFGQLNPAQASFTNVNDYSANIQSYNQQPTFSQPGLFDQNLPEGLTSSASYDQQGSNLYSDFGSSGLNGSFDPPLYADANTSNGGDYLSGVLDPTLLTGQQPSLDPSNLMNTMTTQAQQSPTPPHLLSPAMNRQASSSPHNSPGLQQGGFQQPGRHSRNTSLDPSSARYPPQMMHGGEWSGVSFTQHRRAASDALSEASSAHPSPYLGHVDNFDQVDNNGNSPMLNAQQDPSMYNDVMAIGNFSIADVQNPYISPAHSPQPSPRMLPQQHLPSFTSADHYGMMAPPINSYNNGNQGLEMFPGQGQEAFPALNAGDAMSPPEINIQLAPPSRQTSFEPAREDEPSEGALSPPDSSM